MRLLRSIVATTGALAVVAALVAPAAAQSPGGPYDRLSRRDQRIARMLFEAQRPGLPPGGRMTLDQIAARKRGAGWGTVAQEMRSEGLLTAKARGRVLDNGRSQDVAAYRWLFRIDRAHDGE